jgi:hypothetical protein
VVSPEQVRTVVLSFPETGEEADRFAFFVVNKGKKKGIAWVWLERVTTKKARVANPKVMAVRVPGLDWKEAYIANNPKAFFTEAHYNNYPAILVRLEEVELSELSEMLLEAWRMVAPRVLVAAHDQGVNR